MTAAQLALNLFAPAADRPYIIRDPHTGQLTDDERERLARVHLNVKWPHPLLATDRCCCGHTWRYHRAASGVACTGPTGDRQLHWCECPGWRREP